MSISALAILLLSMLSFDSSVPIFLGITHKAARRGHAWDLIGLTRLVLFPFFPQKITGLQCLLGLHRDLVVKGMDISYRLIFTDLSRSGNQAWCNQTIRLLEHAGSEIPANPGGFTFNPSSPEDHNATYGWGLFRSDGAESGSYELLPFPAPPLLLMGPAKISVDIERNDRKEHLGEFICAFVAPPPLADDERRAISARPNAVKVVSFGIGCNLCRENIEVYLALNPAADRPSGLSDRALELVSAPDHWTCSCGRHNADLSYLKLGLHDIFRHPNKNTSEEFTFQFTPLYEAHRIETIVTEYEKLLVERPSEERIQQFLETHSIFWGFLSPIRILHKPAVLTKKKADFGIVSAQQVLYLVEIEKPSTKLINKDEAIAADIQKGVNQIRDWSLVVDDHRGALLSELGLSDLGIREVRYILIGGMSAKTSAIGLTKLRRAELAPKTQFYCFDELASFLRVVIGELSRV